MLPRAIRLHLGDEREPTDQEARGAEGTRQLAGRVEHFSPALLDHVVEELAAHSRIVLRGS
eukprot:5163054-Alexandrium_andersonii.AAC.1